MTQLNEVLKELSDVQDALLALPDDAFGEKYELQQRRDELRETAAAFSEDLEAQRSSDDLWVELKALRRQLRALDGQRINLVSQAGSDQMSALGGVLLNTAISEGQGVDAVVARIGRIEGILIDRGEALPK